MLRTLSSVILSSRAFFASSASSVRLASSCRSSLISLRNEAQRWAEQAHANIWLLRRRQSGDTASADCQATVRKTPRPSSRECSVSFALAKTSVSVVKGTRRGRDRRACVRLPFQRSTHRSLLRRAASLVLVGGSLPPKSAGFSHVVVLVTFGSVQRATIGNRSSACVRVRVFCCSKRQTMCQV